MRTEIGTGVLLMTKMKTFLGAAGAAVLASLAMAPAASAEDREFSWSITTGGTSDYVFRGISLTNEDPAAQGSIDFGYGIFYAGAWASNVDGAGYTPWELDLYAGIKPVWNGVTFDFGLIGYTYPDADNAGDYVEFKAGASGEIAKGLTLGGTFYYVPDQDNSVEVWTVEGALSYALPQFHVFSPTLSGGLGYTEAESGSAFFLGLDDSYTYWNAGLSLGVEKLTLDFRYWDTNIDSDLADSRFVFSAKVTLP